MIPKIIHYCWLSDDPIPEDMQRYMTTWKKHLPDYEFVKWDFSRFDINSSIWVKEAFENRKYAFAADYIRMYALYTMGGIYLDMDVEVLKDFNDLLNLDYFICYENSEFKMPEVAAFGAKKGCEWIGFVEKYYRNRHFVKSDGTFDTKTLPSITRDVIKENGFRLIEVNSIDDICYSNSDIFILPYDYFSPKSYQTGKISLTNRTYSIHQFSGSWLPWEQRLELKFWHFLGFKSHLFTRRLDILIAKLFHITR